MIALLAACGDDDEPPPANAAADVAETVTADSGAPDTVNTPVDATDVSGEPDIGPGPGPTLSAGPAPPTLPDLCAEEPEAPVPVAWPMDATKVSVSVFHYNIQYVAGGLDDYLGTWTASEEEIEDLIITESFEPVLDLFLDHPDWGAGLELQGLMLEIMSERHPTVLRKLHTLARRGQVDVLSYHWSDQLVTAYGRRDMEWSWAENQRVFEALCMPRAPIHFLQEGQFGPGIALFADEMEGGTLILPRNLLKLFHQPKPVGLLYDHLGARTLVTDGHSAEGLTLGWNYADDGELVATSNTNPYLLDLFEHDPAYLKAEYTDKLQALADDGWTIAPLSHYLAIVEARNVAPTTIDPPVLDGSWQPRDTQSMHLWMGGSGQAPGDERDNQVLTGNVQARHRLRAAEWLLAEATDQGIDVTQAEATLRYAVRELLLAEVSDSTGWRPVKTEVQYSLTHQAEAAARADEVARWLLWQLGHTEPGPYTVDAANATIEAGAPAIAEGVDGAPPPGMEAAALVTPREGVLTWRTVADADPPYTELEVHLPALDSEATGAESPDPVRLELPLLFDQIAYCPALLEGSPVLALPLSGYAFVTDDEMTLGLPLPNGLLGLAPELTLVLDQSTIHLAAVIEPGKVVFEDLTAPEHEAVTWRLRFYTLGAEATRKYANRLNVHPAVVFEQAAP